MIRTSSLLKSAAVLSAVALSLPAAAALVQVKVTTQNLAPANSVSFAPLHVGFHQGTFDAFDIGHAASPEIVSVAENGSGSAWLPAFAAADPTATIGTVTGPLLPGQTQSATFLVDPAVNRYFTFAAMVVPSNDFFIGNDAPQGLQIFDGAGNLAINTISQRARQIWDAGSEVFDPAAAAFVVGGDNTLHDGQNSVVAFNFAEFAAYNGVSTAGGYVFSSQLAADTEVYRISLEVTPVPEPQTYAMLMTGLVAVGFAARRRRPRHG